MTEASEHARASIPLPGPAGARSAANPAAAAGRLPTGQWQSRLDELRELPPAESLAGAEALLGELEQGLDSL